MTEHSPQLVRIELGEGPFKRLDKAVHGVLPASLGISRSRLTGLIKEGFLRTLEGDSVRDPSAKVVPLSAFDLTLPEIEEIEAVAENIPLNIIHEDADLIVVNKEAGMVVHPAPGASRGTLVNGLLYHCGESLSGIGGAKRPGIVHRIDKDTSGILVVAKSDRAHQGLARQFADHSIERLYDAFLWGRPSAADPRLSGMGSVRFEEGGVLKVTAPLARHPNDRKKMAVVKSGGRHAVTRVFEVSPLSDFATHVTCQLETGRTHQIRVHMTHIGHPLIGDPVYGRSRTVPKGAPDTLHNTLASFKRQALHARSLGFIHPETGEMMRFEADIPGDMRALKEAFSAD